MKQRMTKEQIEKKKKRIKLEELDQLKLKK